MASASSSFPKPSAKPGSTIISARSSSRWPRARRAPAWRRAVERGEERLARLGLPRLQLAPLVEAHQPRVADAEHAGLPHQLEVIPGGVVGLGPHQHPARVVQVRLLAVLGRRGRGEVEPGARLVLPRAAAGELGRPRLVGVAEQHRAPAGRPHQPDAAVEEERRLARVVDVAAEQVVMPSSSDEAGFSSPIISARSGVEGRRDEAAAEDGRPSGCPGRAGAGR